MTTRSLSAACLALAMLATTACHSIRVTDMDDGRELRPAVPTAAARSSRVVVAHFVLDTVQRYDTEIEYTSTTITKTWKETPGQVDLSGDLARNLRELGFEDVSYQPDASGDRYVVGALAPAAIDVSAGQIVWNSLVFLPAMLLPIPMFDDDAVRATITLYDPGGRRVWTRKLDLDVDFTGYGFWAWGSKSSSISDRVLELVAQEVAAGLSTTVSEPGTR